MGCCVGVHWDPNVHQARTLKIGDVIWAGEEEYTVMTITSRYKADETPQVSFSARRITGDGALNMSGSIDDGRLTLSVNHGREWGIKGHVRNMLGPKRPRRSELTARLTSTSSR